VHVLSKHDAPVNSISFNPEGDFLVSGALDGVINIWSIQVRNALVVSVTMLL